MCTREADFTLVCDIFIVSLETNCRQTRINIKTDILSSAITVQSAKLPFLLLNSDFSELWTRLVLNDFVNK